MGDLFINLEGEQYYGAIYFQKNPTVTHREVSEAGSKAFISGLLTAKN